MIARRRRSFHPCVWYHKEHSMLGEGERDSRGPWDTGSSALSWLADPSVYAWGDKSLTGHLSQCPQLYVGEKGSLTELGLADWGGLASQ